MGYYHSNVSHPRASSLSVKYPVLFLCMLGWLGATGAALAEIPSPPDDLIAPVVQPQELIKAEPPAPEPPPPEEPKDSVAATPLQPPSSEGYGLMDDKSGGLGPDIWQASSLGIVVPLLEDAGSAFTRGTVDEPAWRNIMQQLALTHAMEPGDAASGEGFLASRALLAAAAGAPDKAQQLLQPRALALPEDKAQRLAAIFLMEGKIKEACADAHLAAPEAPFWQKLGVVCALSTGDVAKIQLALDIMREASEPDELFIEIAENAAGGKKQISSKAKPPAMHVLHAALLAASGAIPTAAMLTPLALTPYPLLLQIKGPDVWKAGVALALARSKRISPEALRTVFEKFTLRPEILAKLRADPKLLASEKLLPPALRPAYALRAALSLEPGKGAGLLAMLISQLSREDLAGSLGHVILEAGPEPSPAQAKNAASFARLSLLLGDRNVKTWLDMAGKTPELNTLAAARGVLANTDEALALYARSPLVPLENRADALALLQGLGISVGEKTKAALAALDTTMPDASYDAELENCLQQKRTGEALLRTMLLSPPDAVSVLLLKIKTLRALGFEKEALELALPGL